jgi:inner membrane protein
MDSLTHGLAGAVLAETGFAQHLGRRARWLMAGAAMLPDADILYRINGIATYIEEHRGVTHSFAGILILGIAIGVLAGRFDKERRYLSWISASWLALLSHQLMDLITSYGTMVLYPFSKTRYYFDWVFIIDVFFSLILLMTLIVTRRNIDHARRRALIGIVVAAGYVGFCAINHTLALNHLKQSAEEQKIAYSSAAAVPQFGMPFWWSGILANETHYYQSRFWSFRKPEGPFLIFNKTNGSFFEQKARESEMGILFYWFARYPAVSERVEGRFHIVEFTDLRFYMRVQAMKTLKLRKPFVLRIKMDNEGKILESRFIRS